MPVLSATDSIGPAFRHTTQQMFRRFRFAFWLRMAVLGFFTAEISSGGGFNGNLPSSFRNGGGHHGNLGPLTGKLAWFTPLHILELAFAIAIVVIVLTLIFTYINSILRFVLFDAILHGDTRIAEGWRKWRETGTRYFVWQLLLAVVAWGLMLVCVALPLFLLWQGHHIGFWHIDGVAVAVLMLAGLFWFLLAMAVLIVSVLAKDFVVPIMALDGVGWQEGWRSFLDIARGHASEYVVYFLMKIVMRIGAGIVQGIIVGIVVVILMIPAVVAVLAGVAMGVGATLVVKALLITIGIVALLLFIAFVMALTAFVGAPVAFFFPAYSIYFFAGRYGPLARIVFPEPPAPIVPPGVVAPEPPPMPA